MLDLSTENQENNIYIKFIMLTLLTSNFIYFLGFNPEHCNISEFEILFSMWNCHKASKQDTTIHKGTNPDWTKSKFNSGLLKTWPQKFGLDLDHIPKMKIQIQATGFLGFEFWFMLKPDTWIFYTKINMTNIEIFILFLIEAKCRISQIKKIRYRGILGTYGQLEMVMFGP